MVSGSALQLEPCYDIVAPPYPLSAKTSSFFCSCGTLLQQGKRVGEYEDVVCRLFPHTLKGAAASWYFGLPANSIPDWDTFERVFRSKYTAQKTHDFWAVKKREE